MLKKLRSECFWSQVDNLFVPNHWESYCSAGGRNVHCFGLLLVSIMVSCISVPTVKLFLPYPNWMLKLEEEEYPIYMFVIFSSFGGPLNSSPRCHSKQNFVYGLLGTQVCIVPVPAAGTMQSPEAALPKGLVSRLSLSQSQGPSWA